MALRQSRLSQIGDTANPKANASHEGLIRPCFLVVCTAAAIAITGVFAATGISTTPAHALDANCGVGKSVDDVSYREAHDVYLCLERKMFDGYNTGDTSASTGLGTRQARCQQTPAFTATASSSPM